MAISIISKLKPANNGKFSLMDAGDVEMEDGSRLEDAMKLRPEIQTVSELPQDAAEHPNTLYLVLDEDGG